MITLIATAAVLSCNEAQQLVNRVNPQYFTRREYKEIVRVIKDSAPKRCHLYTYRTARFRRPRPIRRAHWQHPGVRPGWRPPSIYIAPWGEPSLTFRF